MSRLTLQERLCRGLTLRGCAEVPSTSRRRRQFTTSPPGREFFFVGTGGSLRCGRSITHSIATARTGLRADLLRDVPEVTRTGPRSTIRSAL